MEHASTSQDLPEPSYNRPVAHIRPRLLHSLGQQASPSTCALNICAASTSSELAQKNQLPACLQPSVAFAAGDLAVMRTPNLLGTTRPESG